MKEACKGGLKELSSPGQLENEPPDGLWLDPEHTVSTMDPESDPLALVNMDSSQDAGETNFSLQS